MQSSSRIPKRHLVLLGLGHTNAHILRMWGMHAFNDTELTCISNDQVATYSGMLPAVLAGQIPPAQMEIDLVRLCASVNARLLVNRVVGLDLDAREVLFDNRPPAPFTALSIGIGSVPTTGEVEIHPDCLSGSGGLVKIKPMQTFLARLSDAIRGARSRGDGQRTLRVLVVGGGVAGVEITCCLPSFLDSQVDRWELAIVTRSEHLLTNLTAGARRRIDREMRRRGVRVATSAAVTAVKPGSVVLEGDEVIPADVVIWATGAAPPPLLEKLGLPLCPRGFLATNHRLQTTAERDLPIFAVGDTGSIVDDPLPKSGVYAVREGPVLWDNLHRRLDGRPLRRFSPQSTFMRLINLGDGRAVGQWRGISFAGRWAMRWKDWIDQRFMDKFEPRPMELPDDEPMMCRGCGCKLGPAPLAAALRSHNGGGRLLGDDAAEIGPAAAHDDTTLMASTDFFALPFDDAYLSGRVAALHAASDLIAMGASVDQALANVVVPEGRESDQQRYLSDFLAGAGREFDGLGAAIVGGHTIVGPRAEAGFTVVGATSRQPLRKSGLRPGDALILTKPLGVGVLLAAHMQSRCSARDYASLIEVMLTPQHPFAEIATRLGVSAATDITGFGLAGHLLEMLDASGVAASLCLPDLPALPGAQSALESKIQSSLAPQNDTWRTRAQLLAPQPPAWQLALLSDPQTCGGLLLGVPQEQADEFCQQAVAAQLPKPRIIGQAAIAQDPQAPLLTLQGNGNPQRSQGTRAAGDGACRHA